MPLIQKQNKAAPSRLIAHMMTLGLVVWTLGCKDDPEVLTPPTSPDAPAVSVNDTPPPVTTAPPPTAEAASTTAVSPSANRTASQPLDSSDALARFRIDDDGNRRTDQQALEYLVMITGLGTDAEGSPTLPVQNLEELVSRKFIHHLPPAPAGQKWHLEQGKVSLVTSP